MAGRIERALSISMYLMILIVIVVAYAGPVNDGDLWWQMAYGKYMVGNRTLVPDHSIYTWTPVDNNQIYCAWIAEILLYVLYKAGGLTAIYMLKYLVVLSFLGMAIFFAHKRGVLFHPIAGLICILGILFSQAGTYLKPEILSYVFMSLTVFLWYTIKNSPNGNRWRFFCFPLLMLLWVNSHGGFIFGMVFLSSIAVGEIVNMYFNNQSSIPKDSRPYFFTSVALSGITLLVTPYGLRYVPQLVDMFFSTSTLEIGTIGAYHSVFSNSLKLLELFITGAGILLYLFLKTGKKFRADWSKIIPLVIFGVLYCVYLRLTYFFAPVFTFFSLELLSLMKAGEPEKQGRLFYLPWFAALCVGLYFTAATLYSGAYGDTSYGLLYFGKNYFDPADEANFIKTNFPGRKIGNNYNQGGYLLWELAPETRIMIDPRYFPFKEWYKYYHDYFKNGRAINKFLKMFPCDVVCLEHRSDVAVKDYFLDSPGWRLVFYGPSASVFVKSDLGFPLREMQTGGGVRNIKSLRQAMTVLDFATDIRDWRTAALVLSDMQRNFTCPWHTGEIDDSSNFLRGKIAYHEHDFYAAASRLRKCQGGSIYSGPLLFNSYVYLAVQDWEKGEIKSAKKWTDEAYVLEPKNPYALFNKGAIEWWIQKHKVKTARPGEVLPGEFIQLENNSIAQWKDLISKFVRMVGQNQAARPAVAVAENILSGRQHNQPPLFYPPKPPKESISPYIPNF